MSEQHLNDTEVVELTKSQIVEKNQQIGLMQGFLTLPFNSKDTSRFFLSNPFDLDIRDRKVRNFKSTPSYTFRADQHVGVDWDCELGIHVLSMSHGTIRSTDIRPNGAKQVDTFLINDFVTASGHLDKMLTKKGASIQRGSILGECGQTGSPGFIHLHISLWDFGKRDPEKWPYSMDLYRDTSDTEEEFVVQESNSHGHLYTIEVGGNGYWTVDNIPQFPLVEIIE